MSYDKQTWENYPSTATPITADRLSHIEDGVYNVTFDVINLAAHVASLLTNNFIGSLAYAENITAEHTTAPSGGTTIPGCTIVIPATPLADVWVEFGGQIGINVGGQGNGGMSCAEWTGGAFPANPNEWALEHFATAQAPTQYGPMVFGKFRLGPTTIDRTFSVGTSTHQEGSSLDTYINNGFVANVSYGKSWIAAYAR